MVKAMDDKQSENLNDSHWHWVIQAYRRVDGENIVGITEIKILAGSEEEAIEKAKIILLRPLYRVKEVWECLGHFDPLLDQEIKIMSLEVQKQMLKMFGK